MRRAERPLGARVLARGLRHPKHHMRMPGIDLMHAREVVLRSSSRIGVVMDGEPRRLSGPIGGRVQDHALKVVMAKEEGEPEG